MSASVEIQLRRLILALLALGFTGVGTELVAIGHYEDPWQIVPLALAGTALATILWQALAGSTSSLQALRLVMLLVIAAGAVGMALHYRGNMEFQLEINPDQSGWALFAKILHAKTPPAFAPGVMAQLGLLGLIYAFRHPALPSSFR